MNTGITYEHALAVWQATEESKSWGAVDWISGIRSHPSLVMLGADEGETYAVMDATNGRILGCDEFGSDKIEGLGVIPLRPKTREGQDGSST